MFDETLLDSASSREPVLGANHGWISLGVGAAGFLAALFGLPSAFVLPGPKVLLTHSVIVAGVVFCYALILCYVVEDARRSGLRVGLWLGVTVLLNLLGFLIYLVRSAAKTGDWRRATVPAAYCFEVLLVGTLVLVPLMHTEALPKLLRGFILPSPPPALGATRATPPAVKTPPHTIPIDLTKVPIAIPKTMALTNREPGASPQEAPVGVGTVPGGVPVGWPEGIRGGLTLLMMSPPPLKTTKPTRIKVGGQVEAAKLIFGPKPEFPPLAKMARIQGTVRLEAIISRDGTIEDLKVLSGHPLLVKAAMQAVARWRYQPTLLNGDPVEVATEIDVNFTLSE